MTNTNRYPAQVFWNEDDKGFIAVAPDLPGCSAFGQTQQEALHELQDAIHAWIEAAQAAGNLVPPPSASASDHHHSGKVLLRMPRRLHERLDRAAKQEGVSLNQYIVYLLSSASAPACPSSRAHLREPLRRPSRNARGP
jgi:predicted RNase H-like HicB family nuclease